MNCPIGIATSASLGVSQPNLCRKFLIPKSSTSKLSFLGVPPPPSSPRLLPSDRDARVYYLMLQTAPLLLGYTLSNYLYFVDRNLTSFVVGFAKFVPLSHPLLLYPVTAHPRSFSHPSFASRSTKHLLPEREKTRPKSGGPIVWAGAAPSMEISHM